MKATNSQLPRNGSTNVQKDFRKRVIVAVFAIVLLYLSDAAQSEESLDRVSRSFETLAGTVSRSVVQIVATGYGTDEDTALGGSILARKRYSGSGVLLDSEGYIVTNAHVVTGARKLQVLLAISNRGPGKSILKPKGDLVDAKLVGTDTETDLAVLKIEANGLSHMELGDSDTLRPGQIVLAFGSPLGLEDSVSMGVISAVARQLKPEDSMIYIQTDAPINPGNSGGPLVDTDGHVIGINTSILSYSGGSEGIGFAAPSNIVRNVYSQIRKTGSVHRGGIGVATQTITPALAAALSLPKDWGVILGDVEPGSPAESAGLKIGDIILTVDGKVVENGRQFDVNLYRRTEDETVALEVLRGAEKMNFQVGIKVEPDDKNEFVGKISPEKNAVPALGVFVLEMDDDLARLIPGLRKQYGVVIAARMADTPYSALQFQPGDVIHSVNGTLIKDLPEFRSILDRLQPGTPIAFQIERMGKLSYVAFETE